VPPRQQGLNLLLPRPAAYRGRIIGDLDTGGSLGRAGHAEACRLPRPAPSPPLGSGPDLPTLQGGPWPAAGTGGQGSMALPKGAPSAAGPALRQGDRPGPLGPGWAAGDSPSRNLALRGFQPGESRHPTLATGRAAGHPSRASGSERGFGAGAVSRHEGAFRLHPTRAPSDSTRGLRVHAALGSRGESLSLASYPKAAGPAGQTASRDLRAEPGP